MNEQYESLNPFICNCKILIVFEIVRLELGLRDWGRQMWFSNLGEMKDIQQLVTPVNKP